MCDRAGSVTSAKLEIGMGTAAVRVRQGGQRRHIQFQLFHPDLERKVPGDRGERDDDLAFRAQFRNDAGHSVEDAAADADIGPDLHAGMGAKQIPLRQAEADALQFLATDGVTSVASQQPQHAGNGDNGQPLPRRIANEHVSREERTLQLDSPVCPVRLFGVQGQVVLNRAGSQMLNNPLFMVGRYMQHVPRVL